ncbi:UNVERIFIED_CONTAM: hypothetical protein RMT77_006931 [Armadillidium vulgare]
MFRKFLAGPLDPFNKTLAKAQSLWNVQNRKTTTDARIKKELRTKLKTARITRWNSLYDSMKDLLKNHDGSITQIICVEQKPCLPVFNKTHRGNYWVHRNNDAYIAVRLDMLQDEKNPCVGVLLPNLFLLKIFLVKF